MIEIFANGIGTSSWYDGITKQYYFQKDQNSEKVMVNGTVKVKQTITDKGSRGFNLGPNNISKIVIGNINSGTFPANTNAIYFVLPPDNVKESMDASNSFCTTYCGYHGSTNENKNNIRVQYSMLGIASEYCLFSRCGSFCNWFGSSPNNNLAVDAMLSVFAHELKQSQILILMFLEKRLGMMQMGMRMLTSALGTLGMFMWTFRPLHTTIFGIFQ